MDTLNKICAINCGIQENASNKNITKCKNLFGFKSIFETIQRFPRYRIVTLILIGRLCNLMGRKMPTINRASLQ